MNKLDIWMEGTLFAEAEAKYGLQNRLNLRSGLVQELCDEISQLRDQVAAPKAAAKVDILVEGRQYAKEEYDADSVPRLGLVHELCDEIETLRNDMETAWGIIANAHGGNWDMASSKSGWKKAAERWRDECWDRIACAVYTARGNEQEVLDLLGPDLDSD